MNPIDLFLHEVLLRTPEVSDALAERYITRGVQEWYKASDTWRPTLEPVITFDGVNQFAIGLPANTVIGKVYWVMANGAPLRPLSTLELAESRLQGAFVHPEGTVELTSTVPRGELTISASVFPTLDNIDMPESLINEHFEPILNTILYLLYAIPEQVWSNMDAASTYAGLASAQVSRAQRSADGRRLNRPLTVRYGGL